MKASDKTLFQSPPSTHQFDPPKLWVKKPNKQQPGYIDILCIYLFIYIYINMILYIIHLNKTDFMICPSAWKNCTFCPQVRRPLRRFLGRGHLSLLYGRLWQRAPWSGLRIHGWWMGMDRHGGTPIARWMVYFRDNIPWKRMIFGGTLILGKLHIMTKKSSSFPTKQ